jgi:hypothetical protein
LVALPPEIESGIVAPAASMGIRRISTDGQAGPNLGSSLESSRDIAILSTSAERLVTIQKPYIVRALARGGRFRLLVPEMDGRFLADVEEVESKHQRRESITEEIVRVKRRLGEAVNEAYDRVQLHGKSKDTLIGSVHVGHFSSHLRSTLILCDSSWGWLTITLPPARAPETPSLELMDAGENSLINACWRHFDRIWEVAESRGDVEEIKTR